MNLRVYGGSDDLIELEGDICEEFGAYDSGESKIRYLAVSDGTLLSIQYDDDGCWRVHVVKTGAGTMVKKTEGTPDGDYTDRVELTTDYVVLWALLGEEIAKGPSWR